MTADKISVELAPEGEYPPGEEWRAKIREAITILGRLDTMKDQWVKVQGIEAPEVNNVRAAAHARAKVGWNEGWQLITRYDRESKTLWMTIQPEEPKEDEEDE